MKGILPLYGNPPSSQSEAQARGGQGFFVPVIFPGFPSLFKHTYLLSNYKNAKYYWTKCVYNFVVTSIQELDPIMPQIKSSPKSPSEV